jgi:catechol 2,3-dioxygenase-like lactoylglutathione lyase family enzyme
MDSIEIVLIKSSLARISPNRETHGYGYDAYFISANQLEFYRKIRQHKVKVVKEMNLTDYRNREFVFEDNEGRWIAVGCKEDSDVVQGLQLSHVAFYCRDIVRMEQFYGDLLGLKRVHVFNEGQEDEFFILGRDNLRIELFKMKNDLIPGNGSFRHFAVEIPSMDNFLALLKQKNIIVDRIIDRSDDTGVFRICFIKDPENNVIEFMEGYRDQ